MVKKCIYLVSTLVLCCNCIFAQTPIERAKILNNYNKNEIAKLKEDLDKAYNERIQRISNHLKTNKKDSINVDENGKKYIIYDVINNKAIYIASTNIESAEATRTNFLHNGGGMGLNLQGENMLIGVWEIDYPYFGHIEFQTTSFPPSLRISSPDYDASTSTIDNHATHVSGTLIASGNNASAKGMAPQASIVSYDANNDAAEASNQASTNALLVSNHSYGVPLFFNGSQNVSDWVPGCYQGDSVLWDQIHFTYPYYLQVVSAGNSGNSNYSAGLANGFDKLTLEKNAKNNLVVANANNPSVASDGTLITANINSSSSQGPSDDGRVKPDIAGDGTALLSSIGTGFQDYGVLSGTSMASPNVAGSLLLLQQLYNDTYSQYMKSATLKGLVCHTADDDSTRPGPDPIFGWGLLNAKAAAELIMNSNTDNAILSELSLNQGSTQSFTFGSSSGNISATICWTDPPGTSQSGILNSPTPALVNDLDIRLIDPDGVTTYLPWKLNLSNVASLATKGDNSVDNVEKIEFNATTPGIYTVEISHKGLLDNNTSQDFSLIVSAPNFTLNTEQFSSSSFHVFPNPNNGEFTLSTGASFEEEIGIEVYDPRGRLIINKRFNNFYGSKTINIGDNVDSGIYILKILTSNTKTSRKLIVK